MNLIHKLNENFPSTNFVGGIFPRKHVSIIAAKAGVGKTWYVLKLLTDLSKGGTIFNNQAYYEPERKCLLFVGETGMGLLAERSRNMHDKPKVENISMVSRVDAIKNNIDVNIDTPNGLGVILDLCNQTQPDIIVFDTLMSFQNGDESEQKNMVGIMTNLMTIAQLRNCAVVVTHHLRKGSKDDKQKQVSQDEIIGSSAIVRLCGNAFVLQKIGFSTYQLSPVKAWWEMPKSLTYEMVKEHDEIYFNEVEINHDLTDRRLELEDFLKNLPDGEKVTVNEMCRKFHIYNKNTVRYCLTKFCAEDGETGGKFSEKQYSHRN